MLHISIFIIDSRTEHSNENESTLNFCLLQKAFIKSIFIHCHLDFIKLSFKDKENVSQHQKSFLFCVFCFVRFSCDKT